MPSQLIKLYGEGFSPLSLSPALWLDASDQSTLYQERTGASATTLVSADADPVGTWKDKSGNGLHVTAPSDAARPTWKTLVQNARNAVRFDGTDDILSTSNIAQELGKVTIFVVTKHTAFGATAARVFNRADNSGSGFLLNVITTNSVYRLAGENAQQRQTANDTATINTNRIITGQLDYAGNSAPNIWINGANANSALQGSTLNPTANLPFSVGHGVRV